MSILFQLALTFGMLSILAVGGGTAVLPEMQTVLAEQFSIDHTAFVHIYSKFNRVITNTKVIKIVRSE
jgi:chromate transporter